MIGKARQAFSNGWMGCETFGRVSFVAVTQIEPQERDDIVTSFARHFVDVYGAPDLAAAKSVAGEEVDQMIDLCVDHAANTLLTVSRALTEAGVRETYRTIAAQDADVMQFAVHAALDEEPHQH